MKGLTPLMFACQNGHYDTVELLLKYGADPNIIGPMRIGRMTAIDIAADKGHKDIVDILKASKNAGMSEQAMAPTFFHSLVRELGQFPKWDILGTYLGLSESEIQVIERDHRDTARRTSVMLNKWIAKDVNASWGKVIDALECLSQIKLANKLKEKYCTSESTLPDTATGPKQAESSPEKELYVSREDFHEMEALGDRYLQLVMDAESAVEESNPPLKKLKRFSQCFMSKEILSVDELFDQLKPFYFLEYIMLEKIVKFFLPQNTLNS